MYDLSKYKLAHQRDYEITLTEIRNGRKLSHWMWYIFPQVKGLGRSSTSEYYGIQNLDEAKEFLADDYLGKHLVEISYALLQIDCNDAKMVMGRPDDIKLKSSMTLFSLATSDEDVFIKVLDKFFGGKKDYRTIKILEKELRNDRVSLVW